MILGKKLVSHKLEVNELVMFRKKQWMHFRKRTASTMTLEKMKPSKARINLRTERVYLHLVTAMEGHQRIMFAFAF